MVSLFDEDTACPVCTGDCIGFPDHQHDITYPFIRGGVVAQEPSVIATERIDNPDGGTALYGVGDKVPHDEAVRLGLVEERAKQGPAEDRAKKPRENRKRKAKATE